LTVSRNLASNSTDAPVALILQSNASDNKSVLRLTQNAQASPVLDIYASSDEGMQFFYNGMGNTTCTIISKYDNPGALFRIGLRGSSGTPIYPLCLYGDGGVYIARNYDSTVTSRPLVSIINDNALDDQPALFIQQDGSEAWIEFKGKAVATGKTSQDEYIMVKSPAGATRYIQLFA
jgi:hypothetical protein